MKGINKTLYEQLQAMLLEDWGADLEFLYSQMEEMHQELKNAECEIFNEWDCFDCVGNFYHSGRIWETRKLNFDCHFGKIVYDCDNKAIDFYIEDGDEVVTLEDNIKHFCSELSEGIKNFENDLKKVKETYELINE